LPDPERELERGQRTYRTGGSFLKSCGERGDGERYPWLLKKKKKHPGWMQKYSPPVEGEKTVNRFRVGQPDQFDEGNLEAQMRP